MNIKIHSILLILLISLSSCAGIKNAHFIHKKANPSNEVKENEVPANLIAAFHQKYPDNIAEKWYKLNTNKYAVSFKKEGIYKYAYFSNFGIFQDEEINDELYYDPYDEYEWEEIPDDY